MKSAIKPSNEIERVKALFEYDILDTQAESVFDDLTELASEICETPISLISLLDPKRQWFKSKVGLTANETSRDIAFCSHAILQDDVFEVSNSLKDERFFDNPLVIGGPEIRFYAGMPLKTPAGHNIGTLCVISDKPKKLSQHQKKALKILAREVISQLELRLQNKKLNLANNFKTQFLSNISHEIRTPLNAIIGLSDLMLQNNELSNFNTKSRAYIEQISLSGEQLLGIINSVLDLGKIEAGKMELELSPINVAEVINNAVVSLESIALKKGVNIYVDKSSYSPTLACLDRTKFSQVLINILNNAIKFTPAHKRVCIKYVYENESLCLSVIDQGIGISAEHQARLFNQYMQLGSSTGEGTGLGLYISKNLVELMGGSIHICSEVGQGTQVDITLPFIPLEDEHLEAPKEQQLALPPVQHILVVEDNKVNQMVLVAMLDKLHIRSTVVDIGEAAISAVKQTNFDVILMDINLPGIDGIQATLELKALNFTGKIIALTADIFRSNDEKALFNEFLTKPIQIDNLSEALNQQISPIAN
ncbi:response regulator [Motilimonas cestriensis]|uniref:histidine kinase n=1 Tax=Motilimonas cestriensis TaxID=2742685 RepID=A0ABS8WIP6_9GAMM|nr:GAF domain-containing hybrid sensor histidine kinase/response regulator [Motilimonas cestriensis]MCE2597230.1 response regulator [Motilimonas cestriensis]